MYGSTCRLALLLFLNNLGRSGAMLGTAERSVSHFVRVEIDVNEWLCMQKRLS